MTADDIRKSVLTVLGEVVPGADLSSIAGDVNFRDQIDMDSMDYLNLVIALHQRLGIDIPEIDFPKLSNLDGCVAYLSARLS